VKPHQAGSARRYARALFDVAQQKGDPAGLRRELQQAAELLDSHPELQKTLTHPAIPAERKRSIAKSVFRGSSDLFSRLLDLLVERKRMTLLPDLARAYDALWNAHRGVVAAQAVTASPLASEQTSALASALGRATGKTVEVSNAIDPEILGGVLVSMEGRVFDGTVRGRLESLRHKLVGGSPAV
jgi:F-type H+-transporting ATPase subunit delta